MEPDWPDVLDLAGPPCPAMLTMHGERYPCDRPTSPDTGDHQGWVHSNMVVQALWTENRNLPNEEQGMQRVTSGQIGAVDLGSVTGEGLTPPLASQVAQEPTELQEPTVQRKGATREFQIDPRLLWVLEKCADEWGALGVAQAAAFMAGYHVKPGFDGLLS